MDNKDEYVYYNMGLCMNKLGDIDKAIKYRGIRPLGH